MFRALCTVLVTAAFVSAPGIAASHSGGLPVSFSVDAESRQTLSPIEPGETLLVSRTATGAPGEVAVELAPPAISASGRYVSFLTVGRLVPIDTNDFPSVYRYDTHTGETRLVSTSLSGGSENAPAGAPEISGNGSLIVFSSIATNLVAGDANGSIEDVFIYNAATGALQIGSVATNGAQANGPSRYPAISNNGRFVGFVSTATNLVSGVGNGHFQVFLRDLQTGITRVISLDGEEVTGNADSAHLVISDDGDRVVFESDASNLIQGDTNAAGDIFLREVSTGKTTRLSVSTAGVQANGVSMAPDLTPDGKYAVFGSSADNLDSGDDNMGGGDCFLRDIDAQQTTILTKPLLARPDGSGVTATISGDGRYVTFEGNDFYVETDHNNHTDAILLDRQTWTFSLISLSDRDAQGNGPSYWAEISDDGRAVAFLSEAGNLVEDDAGVAQDVFVRRAALHSRTLTFLPQVKR